MPLIGVPKVLTPDILHALASMGHGDEIVLADAHFPTSSTAKSSKCGTLELRADACFSLPQLLQAVLKFLPLDEYDRPVYYMDRVDSDKKANLEVKVWREFEAILTQTQRQPITPVYLDRFEFYERAKKAFAVIHTGDGAQYGNIILKKGLVLDS